MPAVRANAPASPAADAVRVAWEHHHAKLWRSVMAWSGDADLASEAVAEAFAQVLRRGDEVHDVGAWVWRSSFRIAAGLLQDQRRRARDLDVRDDHASTFEVPADDLVVLLDALARLTGSDRRLVILSLVGGWPAADIGRILDIKPGTVRVRLHRAKQRLRSELEEHHG